MNGCHASSASPEDCGKDCAANCSALQDKHNSYLAISTILNSLDALVYVSDLQTYELIYLNDYGAKA